MFARIAELREYEAECEKGRFCCDQIVTNAGHQQRHGIKIHGILS